MMITPVLTTHTDLEKIVYDLMYKGNINEFVLDDLLTCIYLHKKMSK